MTRGRLPSQPPPGAEPGDGEASSSGDPLAHALRSSSSWSSTADVELQRDLLARRVFEGAPVTIDRFEVEARAFTRRHVLAFVASIGSREASRV